MQPELTQLFVIIKSQQKYVDWNEYFVFSEQ